MKLVGKIMERFPIQIQAHVVFRNPTFQKLTQFVEATLRARQQ
jgi:hypothetical protein